MARPRKPPGELKTDTLAFRLSPAERLQIEHAASGAGITASEYARMQTLSGRVVVRPSHTLDHAAFDQLRRIGVNLNQLTRLAHQRESIPAGLPEILAAIEQLLVSELSGPAPAPPRAPLAPKPPGLGNGP